MLKSLIPPSYAGRLLLAASLVSVGGVYGLRLVLTQHYDEILFCLSCLIAPLTVAGVFVITAIYGFKHAGHAGPMIVLVMGVLIALVLPTPQPYNEKKIFETHRKEYVQLVEMARKGQLEHSADCPYNFSFAAPAGYAKFSKYCIKVNNEPFFSIQFAPILYDENIVYTDDPARIQDIYGCNQSDDLIQKLDANWFVCTDR